MKITPLSELLIERESPILSVAVQKTDDGMLWITALNTDGRLKRYTASDIRSAVKVFEVVLTDFLVQPLHENDGALTEEELNNILKKEK